MFDLRQRFSVHAGEDCQSRGDSMRRIRSTIQQPKCPVKWDFPRCVGTASIAVNAVPLPSCLTSYLFARATNLLLLLPIILQPLLLQPVLQALLLPYLFSPYSDERRRKCLHITKNCMCTHYSIKCRRSHFVVTALTAKVIPCSISFLKFVSSKHQ